MMKIKSALLAALLLYPISALHAAEAYPEFDKPLGEPKGDATRGGWTYTREFEHASVVVDLEKKTAKIDWKS